MVYIGILKTLYQFEVIFCSFDTVFSLIGPIKIFLSVKKNLHFQNSRHYLQTYWTTKGNLLYYLRSFQNIDSGLQNRIQKVTLTISKYRLIVVKQLYSRMKSKVVMSFIPSHKTPQGFALKTVSYTHLTLPTICSVQISVVAVSLKNHRHG